MTKGRAAVVGTVCIGILGTLAACSAVLGITDYSYPGADGSGGSSSGGEDATSDTGSSSGGSDGGMKDSQAIPLDCATQDGAAGAFNCPCGVTLGCNGYAQNKQLACVSSPDGSSTWSFAGSGCTTGQNCDTRAGSTAGSCQPIVADCMNAQPNEKVCVGQAVIQCGPDLVSESTLTTCMGRACVSGACTGSCEPNATQCTAGQTSQTCDTNGNWDASTACVEQCITTPIADAGIPDGGDAGPTTSACGNFPSCQATGGARPAGADNSCGDNLDVDGGDTDGGEGGSTGGTVDCCTSSAVTGNSASSPFYRSYDGLTTGNTLKNAPAILTGFRLDQYEVTVGRFRQFVNAMVANAPQPQPGQGKHAYLTGGGLAAVGGDAGAGSIEPGYPSGQPMPTVQSTWTGNLACFQGTWTDSAANNENLPITCLTWYEAYAFCIWDGGFLPSEAEWDYAAQGGPGSAPGAQRVYPWANNVGPLNDAGATITAPNNIDCTFANFTPSGSSACVGTASAVGSYSPSGDGKWGQADLAGNVSEWTLDSTAGTPSAYLGNMSGNVCQDCANTSSALSNRIARGGSFNIAQSALYSSYRLSYPPTSRDGTVGVRCARAP